MKKRIKRNNIGFTLIELLAVLVVLAILALISIPITIRIIVQARENSYKRSIETYGNAVETAVGNYLLDNSNSEYINTTWNYQSDDAYINGEKTIKIHYSGKQVVCKNFYIKANGSVKLVGCSVNHNGNKISKNRYNYEDKKLTIHVPTYIKGEQIMFHDYMYYVIDDSAEDKDYVTALKAEPLTPEEIENNKIGSDGVNHLNKNTYSSSGDPFSIRMVNIMNGYGGIAYYSGVNCRYQYDQSSCTNLYDESDIKYIVDAWASNTFLDSELKEVNGYKARLVKLNEMQGLGYSNNGVETSYNFGYTKGPETPSWVFNSNYSYWMYDGWNVTYNSGFIRKENVYQTDGYGYSITVRPVININKKSLQD